jgi:hypothetical protein
MKALTFGFLLAGSLAFATDAFAVVTTDDRGDDGKGNAPCDAPLPLLGLSLLGQLGAGALGWSIYRKQQLA